MGRNKDKPFRFKRFSVRHSRSAHKVGVDGVLSGLLCPLPQNGEPILDAGCGCGVISLIMAQRTEGLQSKIIAIDIDEASAEECDENFKASEWSDRLTVIKESFSDFAERFRSSERRTRFGLIVSNPPYFESGISKPDTPREKARHVGTLSPEILIESSGELLGENGYLSMIVPADRTDRLISLARNCCLKLVLRTDIRGHSSAPVKRVFLTFSRMPFTCLSHAINNNIHHTRSITEEELMPSIEYLTLETTIGHPTEAYRRLGQPFYLYF